ncbi:MAG TPA: site-specific DNA-methyltransferase [Candidatus Marinimicrobia bacterium]|nr:site-specific DNA-methyltransferase [Candidatus Neomarinimicrobiota bacterium]
MKTFKEITINLDSELDAAETMALEELNSYFKPNDFYVTIDQSELTVNLRLLDLQQFSLIKNTVESDFGQEVGKILNEIENSIQSIKSYGIKNGKRLYINYNNERKVKNRVVKEGRRGKYFYALNNKYINQNNELPEQFKNQIICDDSQNVLQKLPNNCVDLVFTSPPYNFGLDYEDSNDDHNWDAYFKKLFRILDECIRVLKYGGRLIINVQPLFSDYIPSHHLISNYCIKKKLIWKGEVLWEKNNYNCKYTAWGSWKSPSNPYLKYTWEFIEIFCKGEMKKTGEKENIDISADEFKEWVVAKWSVATERKMKKYDHPAMFPEKLVERVLKLFSYKNDIIIDPFNGAGTTTAIAKKLSRNYIGIDTSKQYCETARSRLE